MLLALSKNCDSLRFKSVLSEGQCEGKASSSPWARGLHKACDRAESRIFE
jgi:hypothetical protein